MATRATDMTQGSETSLLLRFTLPLLAGNLLQQFYNIADTVIVGKVLGDDALAAVGTTGSITYLFMTLCLGLANGAGIMIAQFFGAGLMQRMRKAVWNSALVTAIFGTIVSIAAVLLTEPALHLLHTPEALMPVAASYMRIACGGTLAVAAYNWINAVMRALGDSKTPLIFLCISSVLNILLDLLFVPVMGFGAPGAAAATVAAQLLSAALCICYAFQKQAALQMETEDFRPDPRMMSLCIRTGIPLALQSSLISVSMVALQRVTNGFGETVMAAYTASMRVEQFVQQPFISLGTAMSVFTGQNTGAEKPERIRRGLRTGLSMSSILGIAVAVVFWIFGGMIVSCFISGSESVAIGFFALRLTSLCYVPLGSIHVVRSFLNGAGDTAFSMIAGITEVLCRVGGAVLMTRGFGMDYKAIWYTTCLTWVVTGAVGLLRYFSGKWKHKSLSA